MARNNSRSAIACRACHSQKLKCNEIPCQRCTARRRECVYPTKERLITVPESYVRELEGRVKAVICDSGAASDLRPVPRTSGTPQPVGELVIQHESLEGSSAEGFVQRLKELSSPSVDNAQTTRCPEANPAGEGHYTYSRLRFDFFQPEVSFKLPPKPYAFHLLSVLEEGFSDYHWYLRSRFHSRLNLTYLDPASQSSDRNWLCRVSVVMALAETWNHGRMSTGESRCRVLTDPPSPPGSEFFEQGLLLLNTAPEEIVVEHVEACNLIAFYCHNLNRRKMAYSFVAQGIAYAKILHLERPLPRREGDPDVRVQNEHRKRVWWTSYCLDRMISTDLGLEPAQLATPDLPSSKELVHAELDEFFDPRLLSAHAQLSEIKRRVVEAAGARCLRAGADERERQRVIGPCLDMLRTWREGLDSAMAFDFTEGVPDEMMVLPFARVLASLYLRYYQCYILLLRPFYLQELAWVTQNRGNARTPSGPESLVPLHPPTDDEAAMVMKVDCFWAARKNCKILLDLCRYGKIARFGYWESYHLFSGLAILSLAEISVTNNISGTSNLGDSDLYSRARTLLEDMAWAGNPASKDHEALLSDVESMVRKLSSASTRARDEGASDLGLQAVGASGFGNEGVTEDVFSGDMDWEDLLSSFAQSIWWQE